MLCGFCKVQDFVCILTFFITATVSLLFIQYFLIYLASDSDDSSRSMYLMLSCYFSLLTVFSCLVFAGIQTRSITLLKWPGRLLVGLIIFGLTATTSFLWIMDRVYSKWIADLEGKSVKLTIMAVIVVFYFIGICKFIKKIESTTANINLQINSDQLVHAHSLNFNNNDPTSTNQPYEAPSASRFANTRHLNSNIHNNNNTPIAIPLIVSPYNCDGKKKFYVFMKDSPKNVANYYVHYGVGTLPEV